MITEKEPYYCDECGHKTFSDCGNPFQQTEDERHLCKRCFSIRQLKCDCCGDVDRHDLLTIVEGERLCNTCKKEIEEYSIELNN